MKFLTWPRILLISIVLILGLIIFFNKYLEYRLDDAFSSFEKEGLELSVSEIDASWFPFRVRFDSLLVVQQNSKDSSSQITFSASEINFKGMKWLPFLRNKNIDFKELRVTKPLLQIWGNPTIDSANVQRETISLNEVNCLDMILANGAVQVYSNLESEEPYLSIDSINSGIHLFRLIGFEESKFTSHYENGYLNFSNLSLMPLHSEIRARLSDFHYSQDSNMIQTGLLELESVLSAEVCLDQKTPYYWVAVSSMKGTSIDLLSCIKSSSLSFETYTINNPNIYVQGLKRDFPNIEKPLLQDFIRNLDSKLVIDSVKINEGLFSLEHYFEGEPVPGKISFNNINGSITNVTNDSLMLVDDPICKASIDAYFMGESRLDCDLQFNLVDPEGVHYYSAYLGPMDMTLINSMVEPAAKVLINEGRMEKLEFHVMSNRSYASGDMVFDYTGLKLDMLDEDTGERKDVFSFLANTLLIKDNNLPDKWPYRTGEISAAREYNRAIFRHWWISIRSGLLSVLLPNYSE